MDDVDLTLKAIYETIPGPDPVWRWIHIVDELAKLAPPQDREPALRAKKLNASATDQAIALILKAVETHLDARARLWGPEKRSTH